MTLEGIDNVDDFVERLDCIEPPGQLISFLTDPLLQKFVELRPLPIVSTRIDLWLATCLEDLYEAERSGTVDQSYLREILEGLLEHAQSSKVRTSVWQTLPIPSPSNYTGATKADTYRTYP